MDTRHFLLTACSNTAGAQRWVDSCSIMTERFVPVLAMYKEHFPTGPHCRVLKIDQPWPGKAMRFIHMANIIRHLGTDRWYIWSDCDDVVFQRHPSLFDSLVPTIRGIASTEGVPIGSIEHLLPFLKNQRFESLRDQEVHNSGVFAMRGDFFLEFSQFLSSVLSPLKTVPNGIDQILFNYWVQQHRKVIVTNNTLCLNLTSRFIPNHGSSLESLDHGFGTLHEGRFVSRNGVEFPIVHANGAAKELLQQWKPNS